MNKNVFFLIFSIVFIFASCQKEVNNPDDDAQDVKKMTDLIVNPDFDWSTTKNVEIAITGVNGAVEQFQTLSVSNSEGDTYLKQAYSIHQSLTTEIVVPAYLNSVVLKYGKLSAELPVQNGQAVYSFPDHIINN